MKSSLILPAFALVAGAFTSGCMSSSAALNKIAIGMTKDQILTILGQPDSMSAQANIEYLTYYLVSDSGYGRDQPYMVRIVDGKVESFGRGFQLYDIQNRPISTTGSASTPPATVIQTTGSSSSSSDIASQLQRLKTMHDQGVLSDDEFAKAKAKVIGGGN
jgi:hypothetical protein